jgi:predicted 3-demethylubiquinone-9 3-methyltransferase (glyoxalase superfamily)
MQKITPHLWYIDNAVGAAKFYASIFPKSRVDRVTTLASDSPSGPEGSVDMVEFTLFGQPFMAISAGPLDAFNHSISFMVNCDNQKEIDRYWTALLEDGGSSEPCGWVRDRYGVSWQVTATELREMLADPDRERAKRATDAMMSMTKIDIAALRAAYEGEPATASAR